ncbi:4'-phosphopantetheinyl transferase family protein, partial [Methylogaea oryzae]
AGPVPEGVEIGVDAECLNRSQASRSLANRFFSSREARWLDSQPPSRVDSEFLRLWTLKEAVAKAAGLGFGLDFQAFHCTIDPLSVCFDAPDWGPSDAWELNNWFVEPCHWVSLAVRRPPGTRLKIHLQHLSSADFPSPA